MEEGSVFPDSNDLCTCRVTSSALDHEKNWFILTKKLCCTRPADFAKNDLFRRFPSQIRTISARELRPTRKHAWPFKTKIPSHPVYVASSFGLCVGLLRQRDIPREGLLNSPQFSKVIEAVNSLDLEPEEAPIFGGNTTSPNRTCTGPQIEDECQLKYPETTETPSDSASTSSLNSTPVSSPARSRLYLEPDQEAPNFGTNTTCTRPNPIGLQVEDQQCQFKHPESPPDSASCGSSLNSTPVSSPTNSPHSGIESIEMIKVSPVGSTTKKRKIASQCQKVLVEISDICEKYHETISCVLGNSFIFGSDDQKDVVRSTVSQVLDIVMEAKGTKKGLSELLAEETNQRVLESMRVPDWVLLYFKLKTQLPDAAWQTLLNLTQLGRSGQNMDTPVLLTKNQIKAIKNMVFSIVRKTLKVKEMDTDFNACGVSLSSVLVWAIREQRLYGADTEQLEFNIKIDGRPLGGKDQVAVGLVPIDFANKSPESALSVYPIAIANCKEKRENVQQLVKTLICEKSRIKKHGIIVDGKKYQVKFTVTLDYKALLLLLKKKDDDDFILGGKGYGVEFCVFCDAVRACTSHGAYPDHTCIDCLRSKANIGRSTGLRDDLTFLLEEDLSHINLCSLHCEMRNMEQLLGSLGLFAHRVGTLDNLNAVLSEYGPESSRSFHRITVKEKPGQQTAVGKHNIKVASFSGCTERLILNNIETIVRAALPIDKVTKFYLECEKTSRKVILDYILFLEQRKKYINDLLQSGSFARNFGLWHEPIDLKQAEVFHSFLTNQWSIWEKRQDEVESTMCNLKESSQVQTQDVEPPKKRKRMGKCKAPKKVIPNDNEICAPYAAQLQVELFLKVCTEWRDIALTLRDKVFGKDELQEIDIHEIKCREWGYHLKHLFGVHLGTGDYGHLTIDHSAMLLREFGSLYKYSGQGFESSHKLHRQLFSKASNHDSSGPGHSLNQILTHWYAGQLLSLRYAFRKAKECIESGKKCFKFRGCGWNSKNYPRWSEKDTSWIGMIEELFTNIFGEDFLVYHYNKAHGTSVSDDVFSSLLDYDHNSWEQDFNSKQTSHADQKPTISGSTSPRETPKKTEMSKEKLLRQSKYEKPKSCGISQQPMLVPNVHANHFQAAFAKAKTRSEIAVLLATIPAVQYLPSSDRNGEIKVQALNKVTDPFSVTKRPSETVVKKADSLLSEKKAANGKLLGVHIPGFGEFSRDGLVLLKNFCKIAQTAKRKSEEHQWLTQFIGYCSSDEIKKIEDALWHTPANDIILRVGQKSIDCISFSDLVGEGHIDNFVIDICIEKFIQDIQAQGNGKALYLPTEFTEWMSSSSEEFKNEKMKKRALLMNDMNDLELIIIPVHMPAHWGLAVIDLVNKRIMFDDGLKVSIPGTALPLFKDALDRLSKLFPFVHTLQSNFWSSCTTVHKFGMPSQVPTAPTSTIGTGSCGIGVILSARDFIAYGPAAANNFKWKYCEMNFHRMKLMLQILRWQ